MTDQEYYPPLLAAKHVAQIMSCSQRKAYDIMNQPHRPIWRMGGSKSTIRLHRDAFLAQLAEESKPKGESA